MQNSMEYEADTTNNNSNEFTLLRRPASDGVLDCTSEYDVGGKSGWRSVCYDQGKQTPCLEMIDKVSFTKKTSMSLGEFAKLYAPSVVAAVEGGPLDQQTMLHSTQQWYKGDVAHSWIDLATESCAVLLSVPRSKLVQSRTAIETHKYPWELPTKQCGFGAV
eukprot:TRINITY_DN10283_c0_g1_i1.p1 TRINITY_DN10283_c0_g1~~TRINITY_DN10283_c0_g1_i1.p1  ORF type:complete len:162 (+),score=14.59 TRINITY_DN10283_c0_g1_i1:210-695(+)